MIASARTPAGREALREGTSMNSSDGNPNNGKVPRAGTNKFAAVFARRRKGAPTGAMDAPPTGAMDAPPTGAMDAPPTGAQNAPPADRVVHEKESSLPETLVPGLVQTPAPLRAAGGDDDVMSQPPAKNAPRAKGPRSKPGIA
jgi:hypothetical protein